MKGAYWDYETVVSQAHGWSIPVYRQKWESDANFERLTRFLMENYRWLRPAAEATIYPVLCHGVACAEQLGVPEYAYELQMLYGMGAEQAQLFGDRGHRVRIYTPFGELIPGMAYLVRRLLENTSNDSFLRQSFTEHVAIEELLMKPADAAADAYARCHSEPAASARSRTSRHCDFSRAEAASETHMERGHRRNGRSVRRRKYPLVINGRAVESKNAIASRNPSHKSQVVGRVSSAGPEEAAMAIEAARRAFKLWSRTEPGYRAEYLELAAAEMHITDFELAACRKSPRSPWQSRGPRRMPTWRKPSISACTMPTRFAGSRPVTVSTGLVKKTSTPTARAASLPSSRPGISRWRFSPA